MPAIFTEETKEIVRNQMLESGYQLIKQYGVRRTTIADITKATGLAKGTFYSFFPSKEEFIYQIVLHKRKLATEMFSSLVETHGKLGPSQLHEYLEYMWKSTDNINLYLSNEDMSYLRARWPEKYLLDVQKDMTTSTWIIDNLDKVRPECDWRVFANMMKSLAIIAYNREMLHQEVFEQTLDALIDAIVNYVYG